MVPLGLVMAAPWWHGSSSPRLGLLQLRARVLEPESVFMCSGPCITAMACPEICVLVCVFCVYTGYLVMLPVAGWLRLVGPVVFCCRLVVPVTCRVICRTVWLVVLCGLSYCVACRTVAVYFVSSTR